MEDSDRRRVRVLDVKENRTKEVEYDYSTMARVKGLMEAVEGTFGVPASRQRLICAGRLMRATELLSVYKLKGNTIHLFPRTSDASPAMRPESSLSDDLELRSGLVRRPLGDEDALAQLSLFDDDAGLDNVERGVFDFRTTDPIAADLGTPREFLWGFVMGFLLGFIMLLYLWERTASHRQKMGILTGATAQLLVKYVHAGRLAAQAPPAT